jgi:NADH-quinone oxidoreductase subunit N
MLNATIIYVLFSIYSYANYVYILSIIKYNSEYASSSSLLLKHKNELTTINDLNSLCFSNKLLSFILISTLLSLIGLPPFIGFIYKYAIFISFSSYSQTCIINICIFTITVVISFYYLRICRNILSSTNNYYYYLYLPLSRNVLYLTVIMFYFNTYVFFISIDHIFVYLNLFY